MAQNIQDWDYKVISKNQKQNINRAHQHNMDVVTVNKKDHMNKHGQLDGRYVAKMLDEEAEETYTNPTVSHEFKIALQQARNQAGLTQEKLAQLINEKKAVITDYEKGTAIPSQGIIFKLEQRLKCKLPRPIPKKKK